MFASGYVPGQIAGLLADSKIKQANPDLAKLFASPQPRKKKERASSGTAEGQAVEEGMKEMHSKTELSPTSMSLTSDSVEQKKKRKRKKRKQLGSNDMTVASVSLDSADVTITKKRKKKAGDQSSVTQIESPEGNDLSVKAAALKNSKKQKKKMQSMSEDDSQSMNSIESDEKNLEATGVSGVGELSKKPGNIAKKPKKKLPGDPNATIFVGNLPHSTDKKVLKKIFKKYGKIVTMRFRCAAPADPKVPKKVAAIKKEFHESRNNINAYVVFENKEQAQSATKANGVQVGKFTIRVDLPQEDKKHDHTRSVFVGNLPFNVEEEPLREHFADCGAIENVRVIRDSKSGLGKGFGYILFKDKDGASFATHLNGEDFQGRKLRIQRSVEQEKSKEKPKEKAKEKAKMSMEVTQKKKKDRHRLRMPTNASSKDYQGIHAQNIQKLKKKQKFQKKHRKSAKMEELAKKDPKTFKQPPKGKSWGENARFRLSLKQKKNKS